MHYPGCELPLSTKEEEEAEGRKEEEPVTTEPFHSRQQQSPRESK